MSEIDAMGDVAAGGLAARALEPATGAVSADGHTAEAACLNCGTALAGDYCHHCGQRGHVHRTLSAFFHDLVHSVFHFDGKLWNTLPLLVWRPGELTRSYVDGQRARFVSPMALFLFSVFLMFAALGSVGSVDPADGLKVRSEFAGDARKAETKVAGLEQQRREALAAGRSTAALDRSLAEARSDAAVLRAIAEKGVVDGTTVQISDRLPKWMADPIAQASRNPDLLLYKLRMNAYKWSWALIPISVPFLWLLFPFSRRFHLYDHMVFVTYSLCFMTLLVVVTTLLVAAGWSGAVAAAMFVVPVHMYRQLRGAYRLTRPGALWRAVLLTLFSMTAATLFVMLIVGMGLFD